MATLGGHIPFGLGTGSLGVQQRHCGASVMAAHRGSYGEDEPPQPSTSRSHHRRNAELELPPAAIPRLGSEDDAGSVRSDGRWT